MSAAAAGGHGDSAAPGDAGSGGDPERSVRDLAARLREVGDRLRDPELSDEQAAELAREAAELVSRAGNEIDRALSEAGDAGP